GGRSDCLETGFLTLLGISLARGSCGGSRAQVGCDVFPGKPERAGVRLSALTLHCASWRRDRESQPTGYPVRAGPSLASILCRFLRRARCRSPSGYALPGPVMFPAIVSCTLRGLSENRSWLKRGRLLAYTAHAKLRFDLDDPVKGPVSRA